MEGHSGALRRCGGGGGGNPSRPVSKLLQPCGLLSALFLLLLAPLRTLAAPRAPDFVSVSYKPEYVVASYIIACVGSGTALQVMKQRTGFKGLRNWLLLVGGSISLGVVGIWCMHFIAMLAVKLEDNNGRHLAMAFEPGMTVLSLFVAVIIIGVGFALAGEPRLVKVWRTCIVGVIGGCGVAVMHYVGMAGVICEANMSLDAGIVAASVIVGIVAATAALLIFFHLQHIWSRNWVLQSVVPMIMGVAVCGMHYTGAAAVTWRLPDVAEAPLDFSRYASNDDLLAIIITFSVFTCAVLLALMFWRMRQLRRHEASKARQLTLAALVRDSQGRILSTLTNTLPSVVIAQIADTNSDGSPSPSDTSRSSGSGSGAIQTLSADFLRMLKISFQWSSVARYQRHLNKLQQEGKLSSSSVARFNAFVNAAQQLARMLNLSVEQLGVLYWNPTGQMLTLIVKNSPATRSSLQHVSAGLRFAEPVQIHGALSELQLPPTVDALSWLSDVSDYHRRVLLPLCGESARDEQLDEFLREVGQELLADQELAADEVPRWRQTLGRFVNTRGHLEALARNSQQWAEVKLDPMVKTQIELQLAAEAAQLQQTTAAQQQIEQLRDTEGPATSPAAAVAGSAAATARRLLGNAGPVNSSLYLGLLHVQVSATGLHILLPRRGPLSMVPLVKLANQHAVGTRELQWLQLQLLKEENANANAVRNSRLRRPAQQTTNVALLQPNTQHFISPNGSPLIPKAVPHLPVPALPGAVVSTSAGPAPASNGLELTKRGAPVHRRSASDNGFMDRDVKEKDGKEQQQPQPQPQQQQQQSRQLPSGSSSASTMGAPRPPPPPLISSEALLSFHSDFLRAREELGKLVGSSMDLVGSQLWTEQCIALSSEVNVIVFLHCSMSRGLPAHYNDRDVQQVPLSVFDIIHAAQFPSRHSPWVRRLLAVAMRAHTGPRRVAGLPAAGYAAPNQGGVRGDGDGGNPAGATGGLLLRPLDEGLQSLLNDPKSRASDLMTEESLQSSLHQLLNGAGGGGGERRAHRDEAPLAHARYIPDDRDADGGGGSSGSDSDDDADEEGRSPHTGNGSARRATYNALPSPSALQMAHLSDNSPRPGAQPNGNGATMSEFGSYLQSPSTAQVQVIPMPTGSGSAGSSTSSSSGSGTSGGGGGGATSPSAAAVVVRSVFDQPSGGGGGGVGSNGVPPRRPNSLRSSRRVSYQPDQQMRFQQLLQPTATGVLLGQERALAQSNGGSSQGDRGSSTSSSGGSNGSGATLQQAGQSSPTQRGHLLVATASDVKPTLV